LAKRVLIVEDHRVVRRLVGSMFERQGFEVSEAEDGAQGVEKAQRTNPDLVILDLTMPVMNGLEAARALHKTRPQIPLLMFTNAAGASLEREAHSAGIAAVICKSNSVDELLSRAKALLTEHVHDA
jgi:two-component system chemotaxis response regulator CheY